MVSAADIAKLDADFKREFDPSINRKHCARWQERKESGYYEQGCIFDLLTELHDFKVIPAMLQELDEDILAMRKRILGGDGELKTDPIRPGGSYGR